MDSVKPLLALFAIIFVLALIIWIPISLVRHFIIFPMNTREYSATANHFVEKVKEYIGEDVTGFVTTDVESVTKCNAQVFRWNERQPRCTVGLSSTGWTKESKTDKQALINAYRRLADYYKNEGWHGEFVDLPAILYPDTNTSKRPIGFTISLQKNKDNTSWLRGKRYSGYHKNCTVSIESPKIDPDETAARPYLTRHAAHLYCQW